MLRVTRYKAKEVASCYKSQLLLMICSKSRGAAASSERASGGGKLIDLAREVLAISRAGLAARSRLNTSGDNETGFLETLDEIVASGRVPAQVLLDRYRGEWNGDISRIYEYSF